MEVAQTASSIFCDTLRSAAYCGIQAPLNGVVQLYDRIADTNHLPDVRFIEPCRPAEPGSVNWTVQQFGGAIGMAASFAIAGKVINGFGGRIAGYVAPHAAEGLSLAPHGFGQAFNRGATLGFAYDLVFKEVNDKNADFFSARFGNAIVGAGTFGIMSGIGTSKNLQTLAAPIRGLISGIPAGIAHANFRSLIDGHGVATAKAMSLDAICFSGVGLTVGTYNRSFYQSVLSPKPLRSTFEMFSQNRTALYPVEKNFWKRY